MDVPDTEHGAMYARSGLSLLAIAREERPGTAWQTIKPDLADVQNRMGIERSRYLV